MAYHVLSCLALELLVPLTGCVNGAKAGGVKRIQNLLFYQNLWADLPNGPGTDHLTVSAQQRQRSQ